MNSQNRSEVEILTWLEKEKQKDNAELLANKRKFIEEIRK
jgi:hypothetical protein